MSPRQRRTQRRRPKRSAGKKILLGFGVVGLFAAIGVAAAVAWALSVYNSAPPIDSLPKINRGATSAIYAADGTRLAYIHADRVRQPVTNKDLPDVLKQATIAIEDRNFYNHGGIDPSAIIRAALKDVAAGAVVQGGSTITQQLVRNLYRTDPHNNIQRKLKEAHWANELETEHSKDWILAQYLNTAPYGTNNGSTAVGVQAAAETYFSKSAKDLNLTEAALIAGLPQAPSDYNPFNAPKAALARRNEVLKAMENQGYISASEYATAVKSGLGLNASDIYSSVKEPLIVDLVEQELIDKYGLRTVRYGGLKVYTTIQPSLQAAAQDSVDNYCGVCLPGQSGPTAALASVDPKTGAIVALASSSSYSNANQFNLAAQGHRQPGSSFKTYVLTTAIKQGIDPDSTYYSGASPKDLTSFCGCGTWIVNNAEAGGGTMNLRSATAASVNVIFAQLGLDVGPDNFAQTAYSMGITSPLGVTPDNQPCRTPGPNCFIVPANAIGGLHLGVTPLEQADAYATLANGGVHHDPTAIGKVVFPDGHTDAVGSDPGDRVLTPGVAYDVTNVLEGVITGGTGTPANIGCYNGMAGKTGTSEDLSDAWFVGYTPMYSTAVWVGHPDSRDYTGFGGPTAGPIWQHYMSTAQNGNCPTFQVPSTLPSLSPFFSDLTSSASSSKSSTTTSSSTTDSTTSTTDTTGTNGSGQCDPTVYNCAGGGFQTQPTPPPAPPPTPSGNGGGGGGIGGGIGPG